MIIYVYKKCSTCQKALNFLKQKNVKFICKEITQEPPSVEELQKMLNFLELKSLFNTSGNLYRELNLSKKLPEISLKASFELLNQNPMLIKRPFLIDDNFGITGFSEEKWNKLIG